jgi:hypothetical protein
VIINQWKESIIVPVHKKGDKTDCSNYRGISLLSTSYNILSNILLSKLSELLGIISVGFDVTDQLLIISLHSSDTCCFVWVRKWSLTLKGEHRLRFFRTGSWGEYLDRRDMKWMEVWQKCIWRNSITCNSSLNIIIMIKERRMRWAGHLSRIGGRGMHIGYWWKCRKKRDK